jgi:hypothetical protein
MEIEIFGPCEMASGVTLPFKTNTLINPERVMLPFQSGATECNSLLKI